jgi:hypothetical protein
MYVTTTAVERISDLYRACYTAEDPQAGWPVIIFLPDTLGCFFLVCHIMFPVGKVYHFFNKCQILPCFMRCAAVLYVHGGRRFIVHADDRKKPGFPFNQDRHAHLALAGNNGVNIFIRNGSIFYQRQYQYAIINILMNNVLSREPWNWRT